MSLAPNQRVKPKHRKQHTRRSLGTPGNCRYESSIRSDLEPREHGLCAGYRFRLWLDPPTITTRCGRLCANSAQPEIAGRDQLYIPARFVQNTKQRKLPAGFEADLVRGSDPRHPRPEDPHRKE